MAALAALAAAAEPLDMAGATGKVCALDEPKRRSSRCRWSAATRRGRDSGGPLRSIILRAIWWNLGTGSERCARAAAS